MAVFHASLLLISYSPCWFLYYSYQWV